MLPNNFSTIGTAMTDDTSRRSLWTRPKDDDNITEWDTSRLRALAIWSAACDPEVELVEDDDILAVEFPEHNVTPEYELDVPYDGQLP